MIKEKDFMLRADRDLLAARFEEKQLKWEKARRHGMFLYVFIRWTLISGGLMSAWVYVSNLYLYPGKLRNVQLLSLIVSSIAISTLTGLWDWRSNEKWYRK